ncbi:DUF2243 domain-containing protein [Methylobacterium frigidaeris]|uniref:DUF2243 domain-containing protein n=1 Tax=Methylobacterium frigidaeris TaxID=2038277 RepID=A0AA37HC76_9HYPH|nr:DUF2243 domain-containing protein [Methylobacterium frigidaeris]PIK68744.1 hypothetical protein CS379_33395 [Methylobacterium frigidaeris]GJD63245.1 hypothetical protein MPEAHAMD_3409 [Methylobacterium frigidaeris]
MTAFTRSWQGLRPRHGLLPGLLIGLGLGGFFDGIVLHQLLQWHHMLSSWYPITSLDALELNTRWDGYFHSATYVFVVLGVFLLWRRGGPRRDFRDGRALAGAVLLGWAAFNLVEGVIDHQILGVHHVNETVPRAAWAWWDAGFLAWGAAMGVAGGLLVRGR